MFLQILNPNPVQIKPGDTAVSFHYKARINQLTENPVTFSLTLDPDVNVLLLNDAGQGVKKISWKDTVGTTINGYTRQFTIRAVNTGTEPLTALVLLDAKTSQGAAAIQSSAYLIVLT